MDHANDLPSEDALKNLTPPALRVYAARNALRTSVFLTANQKLETIWPEDSARHATSLIGIWLGLKLVFDDSSVKDEKDSAAHSTVLSAARSTARSTAAFSNSAARADYDYLLQKTTHGSTSLWPATPLWQGFNAKQIQQLQQRFFTELRALAWIFWKAMYVISGIWKRALPRAGPG